MLVTNLTVNNHRIPVKNLDKVYWSAEGYTKGDLMNYYTQIWPWLAPHLYNRPVSLVRYPDGINGKFFYQKDFPKPPFWVENLPLQSSGKVIHYVMINNLETLLWSINLGCIEVHPWHSVKNRLKYPDYLIFDLDPMPPAGFNEAIEVAKLIQVLLNELGLQAFPKISGATGIHIYLPIKPVYTYKQTSSFVKNIGEIIIKTVPSLATNERKVTNRSGKVYIDYLQNLEGKTIASVYSVRPVTAALVSIPVNWSELPHCHPAQFTLKTAPARVRQVGDLYQPLLLLKQKLPEHLIKAKI
ncbi:MAG TPA: non-homologous end-joining DNA ligase [Bacillota bacterium]